MALCHDPNVLLKILQDHPTLEYRAQENVVFNGFNVIVKQVPPEHEDKIFMIDRYALMKMDTKTIADFRAQLEQKWTPDLMDQNHKTPPRPTAHASAAKYERRHTAGYNPKNIDGGPINGAAIDLPVFPEHHIGAVLARSNVPHTPENRRIAAYAVGMSLDLLVQFLHEQDPDNNLDEVTDFRYMLEQFAEWVGFEKFDPWRK